MSHADEIKRTRENHRDILGIVSEERFYRSLQLITDCVEDNIGVGDYYFGGSGHCWRHSRATQNNRWLAQHLIILQVASDNFLLTMIDIINHHGSRITVNRQDIRN